MDFTLIKSLKGFSPGLLCVIPLTSKDPYRISQDLCHKMGEPSIDAFLALIEQQRPLVESLCKIGTRIQHMFLNDMEFEFESRRISSLDKCTEEQLLSLLQPVSYLETNVYEPQDDWPQQTGWEEDWPVDPTLVPPDTPCDLCHATGDCGCLSSLPKNRHHIICYGGRGRGIQAHATYRGGLVFSKGEYIGELTGELKPLNWSRDCMAVDFRRPDIYDEPVVCQLYCKERSNWVRLVNHSCEPCAVLIANIVSGKARIMLRASRDIWDGTELTISYGSGFFKRDDCLCERCEARSKRAETTLRMPEVYRQSLRLRE
ncbi:SET domain-containing protein [Zopfia rhizophila CBS 207.26]|uniref:SET domain-containing protein n=1 Tax=Zopfia rhizophila CBS 207.26 TaxID=1314779 RepID=A0A6A6DVB1_9PEZI|nr:SET domain-containing protein [Zopfia rhizophila CBS 207.26]